MDWAWGPRPAWWAGSAGVIGQTRIIILTAASEAISEGRPEPIDRAARW